MKRLRDYWSVKAAAEAIPMEYKTLLQRMARGKVKHETFGRMKLIPAREVDRLKQEAAEKRGPVA